MVKMIEPLEGNSSKKYILHTQIAEKIQKYFLISLILFIFEDKNYFDSSIENKNLKFLSIIYF